MRIAILVLLILLSNFTQAQFQPTSAKTAFKNGISIGTRDSTAYTANDSLVVVINRQGRMMYRSTDGYWKLLANAAASDYVPYTGALDNVNLGTYRLTARSLRMDSVYANGSGGAGFYTNSGTKSFSYGAGGSSEATFFGFAGYDANRASSYTARSFTDKNYVDSADGLRVRYSDTTGLLSQVVRTFGTQTIGGNKTFSNDIVVNGVSAGIGGGSIVTNTRFGTTSFSVNTTGNNNTALGSKSLTANTTGSNNTAIGSDALERVSSGTNNTALGVNTLENVTTASDNIGIGSTALRNITTGAGNIALGIGAGSLRNGAAANETSTNSIFIGSNSVASGAGVNEEVVIGNSAIGNGSNTVTIGNSSVTNNYFSGNIRSSNGTAFLKNMANGSGTDSVIVSNNGELRKVAQSSIGSGTYALTNLSNVNGVLSSTYGGAGSVNGILKANGSGVVSAAVAGTDYVVPSALSSYVPYTGATTNVNLGSNTITAGGASLTGGVNMATSSGNVGIGTTSPTDILHLARSGTSVYNAIHFTNPNSTADFYVGIGGSAVANGSLQNNAYLYNVGNSALVFATNDTERMRITSAGRLLLNTTTDNGTDALQVAGSGRFNGNLEIVRNVNGLTRLLISNANSGANSYAETTFQLDATSGGGSVGKYSSGQSYKIISESSTYLYNGASGGQGDIAILNDYGSGAIKLASGGSSTAHLTIASTGAATFSSSVTASGFFESSDKRLKNIVKRDGDVAYFTWKNGSDKLTHIGYIAQEVQKTNPDQVKADESGFLSVNYTEILVQKVRELEKQIAELQNRIK